MLPEKEGHIPGYSGYVPKIKPENLYGRTFGQITYDVQTGKKDHYERFNTTNQLDFVDSLRAKDKPVSGVRCLQKTLKIEKDFRNTLRGNLNDKENVNGDSSQRFQHKTISGYQGHLPGVYAENIFGLTYKDAKEEACKQTEQIKEERTQNFLKESSKIPNLQRTIN